MVNYNQVQQYSTFNTDIKSDPGPVEPTRKRGRPTNYDLWLKNRQECLSNARVSLTTHVARQKRLKANVRERTRMDNLNKSLQTLRDMLPLCDREIYEKPTKLETLQHATRYIYELKTILENNTTLPTASRSEWPTVSGYLELNENAYTSSYSTLINSKFKIQNQF